MAPQNKDVSGSAVISPTLGRGLTEPGLPAVFSSLPLHIVRDCDVQLGQSAPLPLLREDVIDSSLSGSLLAAVMEGHLLQLYPGSSRAPAIIHRCFKSRARQE